MTEFKQKSTNLEQKQKRLVPTRSGKSGRLRNRIIMLVLITLTPVLIIYSYLTVRAEQQGLEEALLDRAEAVAIAGATFAGNSLEEAIASGALTTEQAFDQNYQKFFEFDPANFPEFTGDPNDYDKYHTAYDTFADEHWQEFFDSNITSQDILFAVASDINGYVPTHNTNFSTGDGNPGTDRTKRIFSDDVGLTASRTETVLQQVYQQSGTGATLWDVSAPIYVNGKQWGGFRVGIQLAQNQVRVQEAASRAIISSSILLAIVAVFSWLLGSYITNPIERLTKAAQEATSGNFEAYIEIPKRDEITTLANSFNQMTAQLRDFIGSLEQRVADRTKALATSTEVSRRLSMILDQKELVNDVVNQVRDAFGYYHTQIYFYDEARENLVMAGGTGEAGKMMLAQFHKIAKGRGLVGRAAETNEPILVSDTASNPDWLPNVLLSETKSEVAIPISIGDQVLGVLDVQHDIVDGLKREDIDALQSISNQVAVAVQNARSYSETEEAQKLTRTVIDSTDDWIFIKDQDHRYQLVNQGYANSLHIPIADFIGKDDLELGFPEELVKGNPEKGIAGFWADDRAVMDSGVPKQIPDDFVTIDGNIRVLDTVKVPLRDANNKVWGVLAFTRDITERRSLEEINRKRASQQEAINQITQKIQGTNSIEMALKVAARELGHALGAQTAVHLDTEDEPKTTVAIGESKS